MREFKVEIQDGTNYEFFIHDDGKIEFAGGVEPIGLKHFKRSVLHAEEMVTLMREAYLIHLEVTKL